MKVTQCPIIAVSTRRTPITTTSTTIRTVFWDRRGWRTRPSSNRSPDRCSTRHRRCSRRLTSNRTSSSKDSHLHPGSRWDCRMMCSDVPCARRLGEWVERCSSFVRIKPANRASNNPPTISTFFVTLAQSAEQDQRAPLTFHPKCFSRRPSQHHRIEEVFYSTPAPPDPHHLPQLQAPVKRRPLREHSHSR